MRNLIVKKYKKGFVNPERVFIKLTPSPTHFKVVLPKVFIT